MITSDQLKKRAELDARSRGYHLNPDSDFLGDLIEGLRVNEERYGYPSCPCRIASGIFATDRDIICPCDYRDPDVEEYGACYCALYVNDEIHEGKLKPNPVPERRPFEKVFPNENTENVESSVKTQETNRNLFFCKQCGYVVFREEPPYICPICKAKREMFAEIKSEISLKTS